MPQEFETTGSTGGEVSGDAFAKKGIVLRCGHFAKCMAFSNKISFYFLSTFNFGKIDGEVYGISVMP